MRASWVAPSTSRVARRRSPRPGAPSPVAVTGACDYRLRGAPARRAPRRSPAPTSISSSPFPARAYDDAPWPAPPSLPGADPERRLSAAWLAPRSGARGTADPPSDGAPGPEQQLVSSVADSDGLPDGLAEVAEVAIDADVRHVVAKVPAQTRCCHADEVPDVPAPWCAWGRRHHLTGTESQASTPSPRSAWSHAAPIRTCAQVRQRALRAGAGLVLQRGSHQRSGGLPARTPAPRGGQPASTSPSSWSCCLRALARRRPAATPSPASHRAAAASLVPRPNASRCTVNSAISTLVTLRRASSSPTQPRRGSAQAASVRRF